MIFAQRDPYEAHRVHLEEQEVRGQLTAVVRFNPAIGKTLPTEIVASGFIAIYNMIHQYENVKNWRGVHMGSIYFRDEEDKMLGIIWWNMERRAL